MLVASTKQRRKELDAGKSKTLARLAAPLATCAQWHPCTKTKKLVAMATSLEGLKI